MPNLSRKSLAYGLIVLWLAALLFALWWYQARYVRSFSEQAVIFEGHSLQLPQPISGPGPIRLVHFWDPNCPCNTGNQQHLAELMRNYAPDVAFYAVQKPASQGKLPKPLQALTPLTDFPGALSIPSTPAVGIWNQQGELAYFGPYSAGLSCNSSNSFIEPVLIALRERRPVTVDNTLAVGCFCHWQKP